MENQTRAAARYGEGVAVKMSGCPDASHRRPAASSSTSTGTPSGEGLAHSGKGAGEKGPHVRLCGPFEVAPIE